MDTKAIIHVGIALIFLGIVAFTYLAGSDPSRQQMINIGPLQARVDIQKVMPLSPLVAGLVLVGGILLVVVGIKKSS